MASAGNLAPIDPLGSALWDFDVDVIEDPMLVGGVFANGCAPSRPAPVRRSLVFMDKSTRQECMRWAIDGSPEVEPWMSISKLWDTLHWLVEEFMGYAHPTAKSVFQEYRHTIDPSDVSRRLSEGQLQHQTVLWQMCMGSWWQGVLSPCFLAAYHITSSMSMSCAFDTRHLSVLLDFVDAVLKAVEASAEHHVISQQQVQGLGTSVLLGFGLSWGRLRAKVTFLQQFLRTDANAAVNLSSSNAVSTGSSSHHYGSKFVEAAEEALHQECDGLWNTVNRVLAQPGTSEGIRLVSAAMREFFAKDFMIIAVDKMDGEINHTGNVDYGVTAPAIDSNFDFNASGVHRIDDLRLRPILPRSHDVNLLNQDRQLCQNSLGNFRSGDSAHLVGCGGASSSPARFGGLVAGPVPALRNRADIPKDGKCFYHAMAHALNVTARSPGAGAQHHQRRQEQQQHQRQPVQDLAAQDVIASALHELQLHGVIEAARYTNHEMASRLRAAAAVPDGQLLHPSLWADHEELQLVANAYMVRLIILKPDEECMITLEPRHHHEEPNEVVLELKGDHYTVPS